MAQRPTLPTYEPQFSGAISDGNLHVLMDVGLADELGMSVDELRREIKKVNGLENENVTLKSRIENLEKKEFQEALESVKMLQNKVAQLEENLRIEMSKSASLTSSMEKLKQDMINDVNDERTRLNAVLEQNSKSTMQNISLLKTEVDRNSRAAETIIAELEPRLKTEIEQSNAVLKKDVEKLEGDFRKWGNYTEDLETLKSKFDDQANDEVEEVDDEEPGIALEDQLRITEQSAKAIDILTNHLLSTVWQACSKNTYGFFIRIMLLSGSTFKKQLIPDTYPLILLGLLGVLFSAAMQIILAFYLWTRLPPTYPEINGDNASRKLYRGTDGGRSYYDYPLGFARVPLPAYEFPNYEFANDVCRTVPVVQIVTIGLFLFSILNNVPGVLKNIFIIWFSDRFISVDEEGVTKLHYWRESRDLRKSADRFVQFLYDKFKDPFENEQIRQRVESVRELINEDFDESKLRRDTDLEKLCRSDLERLRVRAGILNPKLDHVCLGVPEENENKSENQNKAYFCTCFTGSVSDSTNTASSETNDKLSQKDDLTAFICEMYLNGCIIQDIKNQKRIKEALKDKEMRLQFEGSKALDQFIALHGESQEKEFKSFACAARRRWMLPECFTEILPEEYPWIDWALSSLKRIGTGMSSFFHGCSCSLSHGKIPRSFFEVCETRSFLAEALRLIDRQNNTKQVGFSKDLLVGKEHLLFKIVRDNCAVWPPPMDIKLWARPIQFCDQARLNLVRIDYLKPSQLRPAAYNWLKRMDKQEDKDEKQKLKEALRNLQQEMREVEEEKEFVLHIVKSKLKRFKEEEKKKIQNTFEKLEDELTAKVIAVRKAINSLIVAQKLKAYRKQRRSCFSRMFKQIYKCLTCISMPGCLYRCLPFLKSTKSTKNPRMVSLLRKYLGRDFADALSAVSFTRECPSGMGWFRLFAFVFGVLPEVVSLIIMAVAGVQYILWSGFKIGSDTQGMEEIILATLAINFIYEIDDAVYDHVFPELYKEAHERDRFDITGFWISSETAAILDKCPSPTWWIWCCSWFRCCSIDPSARECEILESEIAEQDGLKMLSKCDPIKWETSSKDQLAQGYFLGVDLVAAHDSGSTQQTSTQQTSTQQTPCSTISATLDFADREVQDNTQTQSCVCSAQEAPQKGVVTPGIREVVIARGAGGLPGFLFEKAQQPPNNFYIIVEMDPQAVIFDQVQVQDELHAVNGNRIHGLLPEQVTDLLKGAPHTTVHLSVRTPVTREVIITRGADGQLGLHLEKLHPYLNESYTIVNTSLQGVNATCDNINDHDDIHAVDGVIVHNLSPDQVPSFPVVPTASNTLPDEDSRHPTPPVLSAPTDNNKCATAWQVTGQINGSPRLLVSTPLDVSEYKKLDYLEWRALQRQRLTASQKTWLRQMEVRLKARLTMEEQKEMRNLEVLELNFGERQELKELQQQYDGYITQDTVHIIRDQKQLEMLEEFANKLLTAYDQYRLENLRQWISRLKSKEMERLHELMKQPTEVRGLSEFEKISLMQLHHQEHGFGSRLEQLEVLELQQHEPLLFSAEMTVRTGRHRLVTLAATLQRLERMPLTEEEQEELKELQMREKITQLRELRNQAMENLAMFEPSLKDELDELQQRIRSALSGDDSPMLTCLQKLERLKNSAKSRLGPDNRNILEKLQQRSKLDLTKKEKEDLTMMQELARSGDDLNSEEKTQLAMLQNWAKQFPILNDDAHKRLSSNFQRVGMEDIDCVVKELLQSLGETVSSESGVQENQALMKKQLLEMMQPKRSFGRKLTDVEQESLKTLKKEEKCRTLTTLEKCELDQLIKLDNERLAIQLDKFEIMEMENQEKWLKLEVLQKANFGRELTPVEQKRLNTLISESAKPLQGNDKTELERLKKLETERLKIKDIAERLELAVLQQRAKFGRKFTVKEQKDLDDLKKEEEVLKKKSKYLSADDQTKLKILGGLEKMDKEEDKAIQASTKGRHLAETEIYKNRWMEKFNSTIRKAPNLTSHWGKNPFVLAMNMSVSDEWNDMYLAHAYPFLYARKMRYAFANHWWEGFLIFYGKLGMHLLVLVSLTLIVVGGYRTLANCQLFAPTNSSLGIFATQAWPGTCLMNVGRVTDSFAALEGAEADEFMAVSCGPSGYLPDPEEWEKHRNYFAPP